MSSEDPNLQNIPIKTEHGRRIRNAFVAQDGYTLVSFDYSQIELRIAAAVSGDEKMISIFKSNGDIHTAVAMEVFNVSSADVTADMRRKAKVINFGILYGMGVNALRENLGVGTTREESAQFLDAYFKQFPRLREYIDNTKQSTRERGYTETLFGRRRYFPGITSMQPMVVAQAERMAINAPIQGTCADIVKLAMITIDATIAQTYTRDDVRLVMQVHDELVYEIKQTIVDTVAPTILNCMQHIGQDVLRGVPLTADGAQGSTWGTMHDIHI
jgi:DNA polymerase-1